MRPEKQLLLDEIQQKFDDSKNIIVTRYTALKPNDAWQLRSKLAESGGLLEVVKKRVFFKAAEKVGFSVPQTDLTGHVGVVFIHQEDAIASAKAVREFSEATGNSLEIICGKIDGTMLSKEDVQILSKLPSFAEMRASLLGLFTTPMSQVLALFEAVMAQPLSILEQKSENENI